MSKVFRNILVESGEINRILGVGANLSLQTIPKDFLQEVFYDV